MSSVERVDPRVEELWREFAGALRRNFVRRTGNEADADDLVQETFLRVQSGLAGLRDGDRAAAWVGRIARNVWIDSRRARTPEPVDPAAVPDVPEAADDDALSREVAGWLGRFLAELDPDHREVLRRSELAGEPHAAIAADLGLSLSAVKSRVQRGRARLRGLLDACCKLELDARGAPVDCERRAAGEESRGCGDDC